MTRVVKVASENDVKPGELLSVDVDGLGVVLANVDGKYYACQLECTHEGTDLDLGELEGTVLTCISHGSQFDVVTGEVVELPAEGNLIVYEVVVADGGVSIVVPE